jgi:hypothetical protein
LFYSSYKWLPPGPQQSTILFRQANGAAMSLAKVYEKIIHQFPELFEN